MTTTKGSSREVSILTKINSHVTTIASALDAPGTTRAIFAEELMTGNVKVILSGGGFGESLMNATHFSFSWRRGCPGNSEATCPSGPIPKSIRSNCGNPLASDVLTIFRSTKCLRQKLAKLKHELYFATEAFSSSSESNTSTFAFPFPVTASAIDAFVRDPNTLISLSVKDTLFRQTEQDRGVAETEAKVNGTDGDDRRKEENPVGKVRTLEEESRRGEAAMRIVDSASFYTELWKDRWQMSVE
nr:unknown [Ipomoea trifida]